MPLIYLLLFAISQCYSLDKLDLPRRPPVVVLPLGTGNDMARCLRWGGGYEGESIIKILKRVSLGHTVMLDRWHIQFSNSGDGEEEKGDPIPCNIFNNYFSIGVVSTVLYELMIVCVRKIFFKKHVRTNHFLS